MDPIVKKVPTGSGSILDRLTALISLFSKWKNTGVPSGVKFPTSLAAARTWTNSEYGITAEIGSKRDISMSHKVYGNANVTLNGLIGSLKPAKEAKKRVYKTQMALRKSAEDQAEQSALRLRGVTKQFQETDEALRSALRDLGAERQRSADLRRELHKVLEENALLKRELSHGGERLRLV
jgi:hypothetical protein